MERLTFNVGRTGRGGPAVLAGRGIPQPTRVETPHHRFTAIKKRAAVVRERFDADYFWMVAFTALLFFRPQDHLRPLALLHMGSAASTTSTIRATCRSRSTSGIVSASSMLTGCSGTWRATSFGRAPPSWSATRSSTRSSTDGLMPR